MSNTRSKTTATADAKTAKKMATETVPDPEERTTSASTSSSTKGNAIADSKQNKTKKTPKADDAKHTASNRPPSPPAIPTPKPAPSPPPSPAPSPTPSEPASEDNHFQTLFWNGDLPEAKGTIAKIIAQAPLNAQLQQALDLARFLADDKADYRLLNLETTITSCMAAVPGSGQRNLRILFGLGTGAGATGIRDNALTNNFLALHGEIDPGTSIPQVMTLPSSIFQTQIFKLPSNETFERIRLGNNQKPTNWFKPSQLEEAHPLPLLMPITLSSSSTH